MRLPICTAAFSFIVLSIPTASTTTLAADKAASSSITIEALYLGQSIDGLPLITAEDQPADPTQTFDRDLGDLGINPVAGARISWGAQLHGLNWHLSVFAASAFSGSGTFRDFTPGESTNLAYAQGANRDIDTEQSEQAHAYEIDYKSHLTGAEANAIIGETHGARGSVHMTAGVRALHYRYDLNTIAYDGPPSFAGTLANIDRLSTDGSSLLLGGQIGVDVNIPISSRTKLGATLKAGLFASANRTESHLTSDNDPADRLDKSKHSVSLGHLLEVSPRIEVQINERASLVASGMFLWIDGIAEASNEFRTVAIADQGVLGDGHAFFYGGSIGFKYRFGPDVIFASAKDAPAVYRDIPDPSASQGRRIQLEARHLHFDHGTKPLTTADDNTGTNIGREIRTDDIISSSAFGMRASLSTPISPGDLTLSGSYVASSASLKTFVDAGARTSPSYTFATNNTATVTNSVGTAVLQLDQEETLADVEASISLPLASHSSANFSVTFGARALYYGYALNSAAFADADDYSGADTQIDRVAIEGSNVLVGPQIGMSASFDLPQGVRLSGSAKAGIFANWMNAERDFNSDNDTTNRLSTTANDTDYARALEFAGRVEFPITDRVLLTGGGSVLWLDGISDAAEQYANAANASRDIDGNSSLTVFGASLGLQIMLN